MAYMREWLILYLQIYDLRKKFQNIQLGFAKKNVFCAIKLVILHIAPWGTNNFASFTRKDQEHPH